MKKTFLFSLCAAFAMSASAEYVPANQFPGTPDYYNMSLLVKSGNNLEWRDYQASSIELTADSAYIGQLFPQISAAAKVVVRGSYQPETGVISVPYQYLGEGFTYGNLVCPIYIAPIEFVDDEGSWEIVEDKDYILNVNADGTIVTPNGYDPVSNTSGQKCFLALLADAEFYGYGDRELITYVASPKYSPIGNSEQVTLPEGAEPNEYLYYSSKGLAKKQVYIDGSTVYLNGLTDNDSWVMGTISGSQLTVASEQFMGVRDGSFIYFDGITNLHADENGKMVYDVLDALTFDIVGNDFILSEGQVAAIIQTNGDIRYSVSEFKIEKFDGAKPVKPATPTCSFFADRRAFYNAYYCTFDLPVEGVNGEYVESENMEYCIYLDDQIQIMTSAGGFWFVPEGEEVDWVAYNFTDNWYFKPNGIEHDVLVPSGNYTEIGVQTRNVVDGIAVYSDILYLNTKTSYTNHYETRVVEVENDIPTPTDIDGVSAPLSSVQLFDLQGRSVRQASGFVVKDGKVCFIK